jgi:hypothetical protein
MASIADVIFIALFLFPLVVLVPIIYWFCRVPSPHLEAGEQLISRAGASLSIDRLTPTVSGVVTLTSKRLIWRGSSRCNRLMGVANLALDLPLGAITTIEAVSVAMPLRMLRAYRLLIRTPGRELYLGLRRFPYWFSNQETKLTDLLNQTAAMPSDRPVVISALSEGN